MLSNYGITASGVGGVDATGGTISISAGYKYHTFTSNGTFSVLSGPAIVDIIVVGGGGGGAGGSKARAYNTCYQTCYQTCYNTCYSTCNDTPYYDGESGCCHNASYSLTNCCTSVPGDCSCANYNCNGYACNPY